MGFLRDINCSAVKALSGFACLVLLYCGSTGQVAHADLKPRPQLSALFPEPVAQGTGVREVVDKFRKAVEAAGGLDGLDESDRKALNKARNWSDAFYWGLYGASKARPSQFGEWLGGEARVLDVTVWAASSAEVQDRLDACFSQGSLDLNSLPGELFPKQTRGAMLWTYLSAQWANLAGEKGDDLKAAINKALLSRENVKKAADALMASQGGEATRVLRAEKIEDPLKPSDLEKQIEVLKSELRASKDVAEIQMKFAAQARVAKDAAENKASAESKVLEAAHQKALDDAKGKLDKIARELAHKNDELNRLKAASAQVIDIQNERNRTQKLLQIVLASSALLVLVFFLVLVLGWGKARAVRKTLESKESEAGMKLEEVRSALSRSKQEIIRAAEENEKLRAVVKDLEVHSKQLKDGLEKRVMTIPHVAGSSTAATASSDRERKELEAAQSKNRELTSQNSALTGQIANLKADRDRAVADVQALETKMAERQKNEDDLISESKREMTRMTEERENLLSSLKNLEVQKAKLEDKLATKTAAIATIPSGTESSAAATASSDQERKEFEAAQSKNRELTSQNTALTGQIEALKAERDRGFADVQALEARMVEYQQNEQNFRADWEKTLHAEYAGTIDQLNQEKAGLQQQCQIEQASHEALHRQFVEHQTETARVQEELGERLSDAQAELAAANERISVQSKRIEALPTGEIKLLPDVLTREPYLQTTSYLLECAGKISAARILISRLQVANSLAVDLASGALPKTKADAELEKLAEELRLISRQCEVLSKSLGLDLSQADVFRSQMSAALNEWLGTCSLGLRLEPPPVPSKFDGARMVIRAGSGSQVQGLQSWILWGQSPVRPRFPAEIET